MFIFAHRGLKKEYPENTIPAFDAARKLGFDVELDVRLRPDGELVCIHDRDLPKMTDAPRFLDVVEQVITQFSGSQKAAIHVKTDEQGEEQLQILLGAFKRYQLWAKALLFDLTFGAAGEVRKADARIEIALSVGEENYAPSIYTWEQAKSHGHLFDTVWWDEWKVPGAEYTQQRAREIHEEGKKIYAISPELHLEHGHPHALQGYEQDWQNFIRWGIEGVCTAHPRDLAKLLFL